MTNIAEQKSPRKSSSVVVFFHGPAERETAVAFCDRLIARFWTTCQFDVQWWSFSSLPQSESGRRAHELAMNADLVVFAPSTEHGIPPETRRWIECWLQSRSGEREGSVVCLTPEEQESWSDSAHHYLRDVARRAGMDFLREVPESVEQAIPDSPESYTQRAQYVTGVLDEILHRPATPYTLDR